MVLRFPFKLTNKQWIQLVTVLGILFSIWMAIYIKMHPSVFAVGGRFQSFLKDLGIFGPILFICIQVIQVLYPVIPGGLTCVVGHVLFGPLIGFVYNTTGIFLGSIIAFLLARRYGQVFVQSFVSESIYDKYIVYLDKGKMFERFLATAFILPGFPDDFLCMVAGMSQMSLRRFICITLLTKPATLYLYTVLSYNGLQMLNQFFS
ncbi:TVP38/TMEM64 family protein [Streptococcus minor]|uniref:TVP38/TMEM64 family membrane protein n=1 Tax=Streptococcus minor TaxID=229549 RepID=A0A3P1V9Y8_9STRE|nr:TVP38/TMEM64 family protein [Streptococcus minor]RRD30456.1 TVP38/TMEM64 family protein [Streptococcus minor]